MVEGARRKRGAPDAPSVTPSLGRATSPVVFATGEEKGRLACYVILLLLALLFATAALAAPKFPPLTGRVVDDANILSPQAEAKLTQELADLETRTTRQLVVATVPNLQGYEIEDYGYQLLRTWGIGQKDTDNGVILLVAPTERKVRIEVGYGLEPVLTDALSNVILQERVLPRFKAGDMEGGVVSGAEAIVEQLALPDDQAKAKVAQAAAPPQPSRDISLSTIIVIFVVFFMLSRLIGGRRGGLWWLLPVLLSGRGGGGYGGGGGFSGGGGGGGGFSGGGGSGGGGGSSGSW